MHAQQGSDTPNERLPEPFRVLLEALPPLTHERGERPLLYQYSIGDLTGLTDAETRQALRDLAERGVGVITFWRPDEDAEERIPEGLRVAHLQESLGFDVAVDATRLLYGFYDGTEATAHVDEDGQAFFDSSFAGRTMGCPFTLIERAPVIRARMVEYLEAYDEAGVPIDIVTADWEIDGPHEWNEAWAHSKRCVRCRRHLPDIEDFSAFQKRMREMRSALMRETYVEPVLERYPKALITNYATYPHDGWRYWYDFFEAPQPELPHRRDQEALYRPWHHEFVESGFTMAMPVVYTWYATPFWYPEFEDADYRWFYNLLLVGSNAGKSTPPSVPISTFVHWHTTSPPRGPHPTAPQMSADAYQELLWHLLLRGHDRLYSWSPRNELATEMMLLQEVYDASLAYSDWLEHGRPITFEVPTEEQPVVSGLRWGDRVLVRRTEFGGEAAPVTVTVDGRAVEIPSAPGEMQILTLH